MKDDALKHRQHGRRIKDLLNEAFFDSTDLPNREQLKNSFQDIGKRNQWLREFSEHLEKEAQSYEGEKRDAIYRVLATAKAQLSTRRQAKSGTTAGKLSASTKSRYYWTNSSIRALAGPNVEGDSAVELITQRARDLVFEYVQEGGSAEPIDPFDLARYLRLKVEPSEDVAEARTVHAGGGRFVVQYNPTRPEVRTRFSICHEIIHTMFPDCHERVRHRGATHSNIDQDEWQLESLCDVGAAELLMPIGSFKDLGGESLSLDPLLKVRDRLKVSTEAFLLRMVKLTDTPCFVFSASRSDYGGSKCKVDYTFRSRAFEMRIPRWLRVPHHSVVAGLTKFGYTDVAEEHWHKSLGAMRIECVAVSPYPWSIHPRIMGIAIPVEHPTVQVNSIHYVKGDATERRNAEHRIIAQVVNDKTPMWGGGFALFLRRKWPKVQTNFYDWVSAEPTRLHLGNCHLSNVDDKTDVFSIISQKGYKTTLKPSIRYEALRSGLKELASAAIERNATVHMPRIGCGQAKGNWNIVSEMIKYFLCERGIRVTVYDLPGTEFSEKQNTLF
jgi:hypothetical protein